MMCARRRLRSPCTYKWRVPEEDSDHPALTNDLWPKNTQITLHLQMTCAQRRLISPCTYKWCVPEEDSDHPALTNDVCPKKTHITLHLQMIVCPKKTQITLHLQMMCARRRLRSPFTYKWHVPEEDSDHPALTNDMCLKKTHITLHLQMTCARRRLGSPCTYKWRVPEEDSDQPGSLCSLIRIFTVGIKKLWVFGYKWSVQQDSDQFAQMPTLIQIFARHTSFCRFCSQMTCARRRLRLSCTYKWCVPEEVSDQPGSLCSLIRIFTVGIKKLWVFGYKWRVQQDPDQFAQMPTLIQIFAGHTSFCRFCSKNFGKKRKYQAKSYISSPIECLHMRIWMVSNLTTLTSLFPPIECLHMRIWMVSNLTTLTSLFSWDITRNTVFGDLRPGKTQTGLLSFSS